MRQWRVARGGTAAVAAFALAIAVALGAANLWCGNLNQDEGWYLYAAREWAAGRLPYADYFFTQGPLLPMLYGLLAPLWAPHGLAGGRALTALLGLGGALATALLAARAVPTGRRAAAAVTAFLLTAGNVYHSYFTVIPKTYALAAATLVGGLLLLAAVWRPPRPRPWLALPAGVLLAAAAATRFSLGAALPVAGVWLLLGGRRRTPAWLYFGIGGLLGLALLVAPLLLAAPDNFRFAQSFHGARAGGGLLFIAGSLSRLARNYLPLLAVAAVALLLPARSCPPPPAATEDAAPHDPLPLWLAVFAAIFLVHLSGPVPYDDYQVPIMPLAAAAAAVLFWRRLPAAAPRLTLAALLLWCALCAGASPLNQEWFIIRQDRFWPVPKPASDLARLRQLGAELRALVPADQPLLTQDAYLAVEAQRRLPHGFEMGPFGYFPDLDDESARRQHVLSRGLMLAALRDGTAPIAAFSGYGLALGAPEMNELPAAEQAALRAALAERYAPLRTIENFGQAHTPLLIWTRK